jgi:hypothetical protein
MVLAGKLHIVHMDEKARAAACGEHYVNRLEYSFIGNLRNRYHGKLFTKPLHNGGCSYVPFLVPLFWLSGMKLQCSVLRVKSVCPPS